MLKSMDSEYFFIIWPFIYKTGTSILKSLQICHFKKKIGFAEKALWLGPEIYTQGRHIFWKGHKILRSLHLTFDWHYIGQK